MESSNLNSSMSNSPLIAQPVTPNDNLVIEAYAYNDENEELRRQLEDLRRENQELRRMNQNQIIQNVVPNVNHYKKELIKSRIESDEGSDDSDLFEDVQGEPQPPPSMLRNLGSSIASGAASGASILGRGAIKGARTLGPIAASGASILGRGAIKGARTLGTIADEAAREDRSLLLTGMDYLGRPLVNQEETPEIPEEMKKASQPMKKYDYKTRGWIMINVKLAGIFNHHHRFAMTKGLKETLERPGTQLDIRYKDPHEITGQGSHVDMIESMKNNSKIGFWVSLMPSGVTSGIIKTNIDLEKIIRGFLDEPLSSNWKLRGATIPGSGRCKIYVGPGASLKLVKEKMDQGFTIEFEDENDKREVEAMQGGGYRRRNTRRKSRKRNTRRKSRKRNTRRKSKKRNTRRKTKKK